MNAPHGFTYCPACGNTHRDTPAATSDHLAHCDTHGNGE